jgi:hypothetical protein
MPRVKVNIGVKAKEIDITNFVAQSNSDSNKSSKSIEHLKNLRKQGK